MLLKFCTKYIINKINIQGENFDWPIEDVSRIKPAIIEEFPEAQFTCIEDPETESRAQQTLDTYY